MGANVGVTVGAAVGAVVDETVGSAVGPAVGAVVGATDGENVGASVSAAVGEALVGRKLACTVEMGQAPRPSAAPCLQPPTQSRLLGPAHVSHAAEQGMHIPTDTSRICPAEHVVGGTVELPPTQMLPSDTFVPSIGLDKIMTLSPKVLVWVARID